MGQSYIMNISHKIFHRMISENIEFPCKMFWCIPKPVEKNVVWDTMVFDANGDDLSNWIIVIYELKKLWNLDFDACKEHPNCLPRGIMADGFLYHGNNLPNSIDLDTVASSMGCELGNGVTPIYDKKFGVGQDGLNLIQDIIGKNLNIQYTD